MTTPTSKYSPAFQFYPESWFSSSKVSSMSHTERGIYIDLLARCWLDNGLPTDVRKIAALVKIPGPKFQRIWSEGILHECFVERGGKLVNPRQERERKKQIEFRRRQADNGSKGGRPSRNPRKTQEHKPTHNPVVSGEVPLSKARAIEREIEIETRDPKKDEERHDFAFMAFRDAYPEARRKGGFLTQQAYLAAVAAAGSSSVLMLALDNHKASEQWSNPKHIPGMDVWLNEERWRQVLPAVGESEPDDRRTPAWARGL